jgi:hypothetical protein
MADFQRSLIEFQRCFPDANAFTEYLTGANRSQHARQYQMAGRGYTGSPGIVHDPRVVGPIAAHIIVPWTL